MTTPKQRGIVNGYIDAEMAMEKHKAGCEHCKTTGDFNSCREGKRRAMMLESTSTRYRQYLSTKKERGVRD